MNRLFKKLSLQRLLKSVVVVFFLCSVILSGVCVSEFSSFGMRSLNFNNFFIISYFSNSSLIFLFPFILIPFFLKKRLNKRYHGDNDAVEGLIDGNVTKVKEDDRALTWREIYTRSIIFVFLNLFGDLCAFYSLDLIPPSMSMAINQNAPAVVFLLSIFLLWKDVKNNLIFKIFFVGIAFCGVFLIAFGKELAGGGCSDGSNLFEKYPHLVLGMIIAFGYVLGSAIWDVLFVKMFSGLNFQQILLLNFFCGLNCLVVFWVFVPFFHFVGIQRIEFVSLTHTLLTMAFLCGTSFLTMIFLLSFSILFYVFPYPTLVNIICMSAEVGIVICFDTLFLGVRYGYAVFFGLGLIFLGAILLNIAEVIPFDIPTLLYRCVLLKSFKKIRMKFVNIAQKIIEITIFAVEVINNMRIRRIRRKRKRNNKKLPKKVVIEMYGSFESIMDP